MKTEDVVNKSTALKAPAPVTQSTVKLQSQQKTPVKIKPELKPTNKTKPTAHRPEQRPKPDSKPPNKFDSKPSKPDRNPPKLEKPTKKPDQKFQLGQFLNKTQQQLEQLSDKLVTFYQTAANNKPNKYSASTTKPTKAPTTEKSKTTTATSKPPITSVKPTRPTPPTFAPSFKPNRQPVKTETVMKPPEIKLQADKILVVNNQSKKPPKNKLSGSNKTNAKNPFPASFPFLGSKENVTSFEETILRYPTNLDKQVEGVAEENSQPETATNISFVSSKF